MRRRRETAPAEGERRAIGGYYNQYQISASLILRSLRDGNLQWIKIADPEAGRVDDFQIGRQSRVDAYQVKWSKYPTNFSFNDLISKRKGKPSLISQLADGWVKLQKSYPSNKIVVHLVTNDIPSNSDNLPVNASASKTRLHFAPFIDLAWKQAKKQLSFGNSFNVLEDWKPAWKSLQESSGLSEGNFEAFVRDCELEFSYDYPRFDQTLSKDAEIAKKDLEHITQSLFAEVAGPDRIIKLDREKLLSELGWTERVEFKNLHEFPVDKKLYQPIKSVICKFRDAINNLQGGYVAVIGTPGSGKSTLLTQTLRHCRERVIRYYAYVPDAQDSRRLRGESAYFLHDVVLDIERAGVEFHVGESISRFDRGQLLKRFHDQLKLLHQDWKSTSRKTIILIDGLDHITREQNPDHPLMEDLPDPDQVPEGVYIVLGSQTDTVLPPRIRAAINNSNRRIEMQPLNRESTLKIIERIDLSVILSSDQKEKISYLSDGHPLALMYILNRLREINDIKDLSIILDGTKPFRGNIEEQYSSYWSQNFDSDYQLTFLLGKLSRLRGVIDLLWVETWSERSVVDRLRKLAAHYFKREDQNHWYFFHNSFRIFLNQKTAESSPGSFDKLRDRSIHKELAVICSQDPKTKPWMWDELYHWALAEEHEEVLRRASQDWFRNQFYAFRPIDAVRADIRLAMRSAFACKDLVAFSRILLIATEIDDRGSYLEDVSIIPLLLSVGDKQIAIEYIRDGNRLRINSKDALKLCSKLISFDLTEEAKRIFELSEPLDLLVEPKPIEGVRHDDKIELLEAWAESAVYFRSLCDIIKTIRGISREKDEIRQVDNLIATQELQNKLFYLIGCVLLNEKRWDDFEIVSNLFNPSNATDRNVWFWLQAHAWKALADSGEKSKAVDLITGVDDKIDSLDLDPESCVVLADGVYRLLGDVQKVKDLLRKVPPPEPKIDSYVSDRLNQFYHRFHLVRLYYSLGDVRSPNEIIPGPKEDRERGMVIFERSLCVIAHIWAKAWLGEQIDVRTLKKAFSPLLYIFVRHNESPQDSVSWYAMGGAREEFYRLLVNAVHLHGPRALESLQEEFERAWNNSETGIFWPTETRRQIILELNRVRQNRKWAIGCLTSLEDKMLDNKDINGRIKECAEQADAWAALGEKESIHRILEKMLKVSFGVGYRKDYQFNIWIDWLNRINGIEPEKASERIEWFARAIVSLENTTEGRASLYAANDLLAVSFRWSPRRAVHLFRWFIDQRIIVHEEAFCTLLKEALKADNSVTQLALFSLFDFILPISIDAYPELSNLIIEKTAIDASDKAIEAAKYMLDKLKIYALPSTRKSWQYGIVQAILKNGLDLSRLELDDSTFQFDTEKEASSSLLKLENGSYLRIDEVMKQVTSIENLKDLLIKEPTSSYFNWSPIIEHLVEDLDLKGLHELVNLIEGKNYSAQVLSIISRRFFELNDLENAWSVGLKSFEASKSWGWDRQYDGGSRFYAFEALIQANATEGHSRLWEVLEQDLNDQSWLPQRLLFNLEDIILLMADEPPFKEIWNDIEHYIYALFEASKFPTNNSMRFQHSPKQDTPARAIADLLATHLNHPVNIVAQSARRTCAKLLMQNNLEIQDSLHEFLEVDESYQEAILMVLDAISLQSPDSIRMFSKEILTLCGSSNYAIRRTARIVVPRIGCQIANDESKMVTSEFLLPLTYLLNIPKLSAQMQQNKLEITDEGLLPDSNDPVEIIGPFGFQIELIAKEAALPEINLFYRAIEIMRQLMPSDSWSKQGEKDLRATLESARLQFTFHRPRPHLARRAIYHIIIELFNAGLLYAKNLRNIDPFLGFYDPTMVLAEPMSRPNFIMSLTGLSKYGDKSRIWIEKAIEALDSVVFKTTDGLVLLAEDTALKHLARGTPNETRKIVLCLSDTPIAPSYDEFHTFFHHENNILISEYFDLLIEQVPTPLIILNKSLDYDSPGENWLALNPVVARQMGWRLSKDGLFRWVNNEGQTMVESIWWSDGFIEQRPPRFDDDVGEGWLVIASQNALSDIKSKFNKLKRIVSITRSFYQDGRQLKHDAQVEFEV